MNQEKIATIIIITAIVIGCTANTIIMMDLTDTSQNTELLKREEIKDSPFTVITETEKKVSFGVMGKYRVTEMYDDPRKVKKELEKITWNRIVQVMLIMQEEKINGIDTTATEVKLKKK